KYLIYFYPEIHSLDEIFVVEVFITSNFFYGANGCKLLPKIFSWEIRPICVVRICFGMALFIRCGAGSISVGAR
ncbi:MAG TPA: hypothetical protein VIO11_02755, partial [Candidatus Methanoperedens sp.]